MGSYYYVFMKNSTSYRDEDSGYKKTETGKLLEPIAKHFSLGYSEPSGLALLGVKSKKDTKREVGLFGIEYNKNIIVDDPVFMICEDNNDGYLEEIITGNKYKKINANIYTEKYSNRLLLSAVKGIPKSKVVEHLRSLSKLEIDKYVNKIHELDRAIAIGFQKDMQRRKNNQIQNQEYESYIKSFRKKSGK